MIKKPFYILIVRNRIAGYPVEDDAKKLEAWLDKNVPVDAVTEFVDTDLELKHKDFGVVIQGGAVGDTKKSAWGLDGIKEQLRQTGKVPAGKYHAIIFLYELIGWDWSKRMLGAWTYPNDLNGAAFCEIPSLSYWEKMDDIYRMMTHEIMHCIHRLAWWKGLVTRDTMDLYDKEFDSDAPDGNRARNLKEIVPHWEKIAAPLPVRILTELQNKVKTKHSYMKTPGPKIIEWANATKRFEGWAPGTRSFKNHNPGNLRYSAYTATLGAIGKDKSNFCTFPTDEAGFDALCLFLTAAASRQLKPYHTFNSANPYHKKIMPDGKNGMEMPEFSLIDFYNVYAPAADHNEPNGYALFIANRMGVPPQTKISSFLM